jgi:hypothetical protein
MTYNIKHTDASVPSLAVYDNTTNTDTSLKFPGRFVAGYGESIAENFLHLLENFASDSEPSSPQIGQLWYDTASGFLRIYGGTGATVAARWKAASGIEYNATNPGPAEVGQLWVDTSNRQLNIYTGSSWMVVGPTVSSKDGLKTGAIVEEIVDLSNAVRSVVVVYVSDTPIAILSKDTFQPKSGITGFGKINAGINLNAPISVLEKAKFYGGLPPMITGIATAATQLIVGSSAIESVKFLRSDVPVHTEYGITIGHNDGVIIGTDRDLTIAYNKTSNAVRIVNNSRGSIDMLTTDGIASKTVVKITGDKVGINNQAPLAHLDVIGDIKTSGKLTIGGGLDHTGPVTRGLIFDQQAKTTVGLTDQLLIYKAGDTHLSKTTISALFANLPTAQQTIAGLASRTSITQTTESLAPAAVPNQTAVPPGKPYLTLANAYKSYAVYSVTVSSAAWVRVYSSSVDADNDKSRVAGTPAPANSGIILDITTTGANQTTRYTPALIGYNNQPTPNTEVYVSVKNTGVAAAAITITITLLKLEA